MKNQTSADPRRLTAITPMQKIKKRLAPSPRPVTDGPGRAVNPETAAHAARYPTARDVLGAADLRTVLASAMRAAAASGLVLVGVAASGCADPVCAPSSIGEVGVHGKTAASDLLSLRVGDSYDELRVGLGIVPHSSGPMMAGEMVPVMPTPMPTPVVTPGGAPDVD